MAIHTAIGHGTPERIVVRGLDLAQEVIGKLDFVDMTYLLAIGRQPVPREKNMLNALLVTCADHGLTPITLSARLTLLGAPESLQGAVAAGLLGGGDTFLGTTQNMCSMLTDALAAAAPDPDDAEIRTIAEQVVAQRLAKRQPVPGYGHPIHVNQDPRVVALLQVSRANGYYSAPWRLALDIEQVLGARKGRKLAMNAVAAMGAMYAEMQLPPIFARGLGLVGRCAGIVAHLLEEKATPMAQELWDLVLREEKIVANVKSDR